MAYIDPNDPRYAEMPVARGPGVHGDEADSALNDIQQYLSPQTLRRLALGSENSPVRPRRNVSGGSVSEADQRSAGENDDPNKAVVPTSMLYRIAMLSTGMWGVYKGHKSIDVQWDAAILEAARREPRSNPDDPASDRALGRKIRLKLFEEERYYPESFQARMKELSDEIQRVLEHAEGMYAQRGGALAAKVAGASDRVRKASERVEMLQRELASPDRSKVESLRAQMRELDAQIGVESSAAARQKLVAKRERVGTAFEREERSLVAKTAKLEADVARAIRALEKMRTGAGKAGEKSIEYRAKQERLVQEKKPAGPWVKMLLDCQAAVKFVLEQLDLPAAQRSIFRGGKPFGLKWGILAEGNQKLPFVAYSELPMSTCPGAGTCGVYIAPIAPEFQTQRQALDYEKALSRLKQQQAEAAAEGRSDPKKASESVAGYCYSFKAWRYPDAFGRQFLNTLANYADREFAIAVGNGGQELPATENVANYMARENAALRGSINPSSNVPWAMQTRAWMQYVKAEVLRKARKKILAGQRVYLRLFVDGDIAFESNIVEWMKVIAAMNEGAHDVLRLVGKKRGGKLGHIEAYGYSKCWQQFVNANGVLQGNWPSNYMLNLSKDSTYANDGRLVAALQSLPIYRGYFDSIPLSRWLPELEATDPNQRFDPPPAGFVPFPFDEERVRTIVWINQLAKMPISEAMSTVLARQPGLLPTEQESQPGQAWTPTTLRYAVLKNYVTSIAMDPRMVDAIKDEVARDQGAKDRVAYEREQLDKRERAYQKALATWESKYGALPEDAERPSRPQRKEGPVFGEKRLYDKTMSLVLMETLWSLGRGGSCPLLCGNCSDQPFGVSPDGSTGVHRCASKTTFRGRRIHIGLH
jgi:hypothetical protein